VYYQIHPDSLAYRASGTEGSEWIVDSHGREAGLVCLDWLVLWLLSRLPNKFSQLDIIQSWANDIPDESERLSLWDSLVSARIIVKENMSCSSSEGSFGAVCGIAASYHRWSRSYPFMDMRHVNALYEDNGKMIDYAKMSAIPPIYQSFDRIESRSLEKAESILRRCQDITNLDKEDRFSLLFDYCFGQRGKLPVGFNEKFHYLQLPSLSKTIPSGGGKHPLEVFFISTKDEVIPIGGYHYNVRDNTLDRLKGAEDVRRIKLLRTRNTRNLGFVIFTSLVERAMWRYRESRSWRAIMIDSGHAIHAFNSLAKILGYQVDGLPIDSNDLIKLFGLDPSAQPVIFAASLLEG
jgi:SagB-type dehydrogenase family enzyme